MQAVRAFGAIVAVAVATSVSADQTQVPIDLGTFGNLGGGPISYDGPFGSYVRSELAPGLDGADHTRMAVDLAGIVVSQDLTGFYGVSIIDAGYNMYGPLSPGADIDLLAPEALAPQIDETFVYEGPNPVHQDQTADLPARRVRLMDSFSRAQDAWHHKHVSPGERGRLEALLSRPMPLVDLSPDEGPMLLFSEAGTAEFFRVRVLAVLPTPGTLVLLTVAAIVARKPRRRGGTHSEAGISRPSRA
ncbi:MAG: hypothetical protein ACYTGD_20035 [Planctomycetota bacterium]|jgi:hypothetical protein